MGSLIYGPCLSGNKSRLSLLYFCRKDRKLETCLYVSCFFKETGVGGRVGLGLGVGVGRDSRLKRILNLSLENSLLLKFTQSFCNFAKFQNDWTTETYDKELLNSSTFAFRMNILCYTSSLHPEDQKSDINGYLVYQPHQEYGWEVYPLGSLRDYVAAIINRWHQDYAIAISISAN